LRSTVTKDASCVADAKERTKREDEYNMESCCLWSQRQVGIGNNATCDRFRSAVTNPRSVAYVMERAKHKDKYNKESCCVDKDEYNKESHCVWSQRRLEIGGNRDNPMCNHLRSAVAEYLSYVFGVMKVVSKKKNNKENYFKAVNFSFQVENFGAV
jgi:hypothetical protein